VCRADAYLNIAGDKTWIYRYDPEKKGPVIGLEISFVPTAEEVSPSSKQDKSVAQSFFPIKTVLYITSFLQLVK
jgi:hypothetical protein